MNYTCPLCKQSAGDTLMSFQQHTDHHIVDLIKHDHPGWSEKDGACQKCYDYYKAEINGGIFKDAPCALRNRSLKKFFSPLVNIFKK